jgi:tetratricopeptide (TPR) repeat protein
MLSLQISGRRASNVIGKTALQICLLLGATLAAAGCGNLESAYKCRSVDPDRRIAGCTAIIQTGQLTPQDLAVIYYNRGTAYNSKGDHDRAIQDYDEGIRLSPNDPAIYMARGISYYEKRDYDHAIQDFDQPISLNPNSAPVYHYYHAVAPNKALAYYYLGNAYDSRGNAYDNKSDYSHAIQDYSEAIQDYNEAIVLNPRNAFAYYGRGQAYDGRGLEDDNKDDYGHAIQDYDEAIRLRPNDAGVYEHRGFTYNQEGDYDRAIQNLTESIRLSPKDAAAYGSRGVAYVYKGDYGPAIQDFNEAIRLAPKLAPAYEARGEAYLFQSNLTAATSDFQNAISEAPSPRIAVGAALMLHVAMKRQGRDDSHQLAQVAAAADLSKWPGPVLKLDMGRMPASEVLAAAAHPGDERQKWHVCQANYFTGEDALFHNDRAKAVARLMAARHECPNWDASYVAALVELKRLGAPPAPGK